MTLNVESKFSKSIIKIKSIWKLSIFLIQRFFICKFVERQADPALMIPDYDYDDDEDIQETMPRTYGTLTRFRFWLIIKSKYFHENTFNYLIW